MAQEEPVNPDRRGCVNDGPSGLATPQGERATPLFHIVLHEPEIPNNTGNIGRTCVATGCALHLVHPLGFDISEKAVRRAGLDYWPRLALTEHANWEACEQALSGRTLWVFSTKATKSVFSATFRRGDAFVFGKETSGLPDSILVSRAATALTFPMMPGERSLNLATAVCNAAYEGVRQLLARNEVTTDEFGKLVVGG